MPTLACPRCDALIDLPTVLIDATIGCPRCRRAFLTRWRYYRKSEATVEEESTPIRRTIPDPLLTANHRCQHCDQALPAAIRQRAATVVCARCTHRTSVYAIDHRCSSCGRLLESPSGLAGRRVECPACRQPLIVPRDVLEIEPPSYSDEYRLAFSCPVCAGEVVARREDAGRYAVCPHCAAAFDVPQGGRALEPVAVAAPNPLHTTKTRTCPACRRRVPVCLTVCPVCQTRPRLSEFW